jgi:hypothetical protein
VIEAIHFHPTSIQQTKHNAFPSKHHPATNMSEKPKQKTAIVIGTSIYTCTSTSPP